MFFVFRDNKESGSKNILPNDKHIHGLIDQCDQRGGFRNRHNVQMGREEGNNYGEIFFPPPPLLSSQSSTICVTLANVPGPPFGSIGGGDRHHAIHLCRRLLLQFCGGENLSLPPPKTFTAVEESGKGIGGRVVQSLVGWQAFGGAWSPLTKVPQSDRHMPQ